MRHSRKFKQYQTILRNFSKTRVRLLLTCSRICNKCTGNSLSMCQLKLSKFLKMLRTQKHCKKKKTIVLSLNVGCFTCMRRRGAEREKQRHYRAERSLLQPPHVQDPLAPLKCLITQPGDYDWESTEAIRVQREREASAAAVLVCSFSLSILLSSKTAKLCPSHSVSASSHSFPNFLPRPLLSLQWCVYVQTPVLNGASRGHVSEIGCVVTLL